MKGVLVDPYTRTIENVEVGDWRDIQKHLQCDCFGSGGYDEGGDAIYVNDEGFILRLRLCICLTYTLIRMRDVCCSLVLMREVTPRMHGLMLRMFRTWITSS